MNIAPVRYRRLLPLVLVSATALVPLLVTGQPGPAAAVPGASAEFRVNTTTALTQAASAVAVDADGDSVVVWASRDQDGSGYGIYAQRYDSAGVAQGVETRVNSFTSGDQTQPSVAMDAEGSYVITWMSLDQDGSGYGIYSRRYSAQGFALNAEFRVNTTTSGRQANPAVAMVAGHGYVVVWDSPDQGGEGVFAQRFGLDDVRLGNETRVNTATTGNQYDATVAMDAAGDYVVTWDSESQDGGADGVYAQRFDRDGGPVGAETRVNTTTAGSQWDPSVATDADGDYVVTWASENQDGSGNGVYAQRFNAGGAPQGAETRVNTTTSGNQWIPGVAMDADGDYVITWASENQDGSGYGIYRRRYDATGAVEGPEARVNTTTANDQYSPSVAMDADGDHLVTWESLDQDTSSFGIYARRLRGPQQVDLAVSQTVDPGPVPVGGRMEYRLRVSNLNEPSTETGVPVLDAATGAATAVRLRITPPDGATLASAAGTDWVCVMRVVVELLLCRYTEPVAPDADAHPLVLTYAASLSAGPVQHLARVSDWHVDPLTSDNSVVDRTVVRCTVGFEEVAYRSPERGALTAAVVRRGFNCHDSSVRYETTGGAASSGADFTDVAGTLLWGDSGPPQAVSVPILDDALDEPDEHLELTLSNPVGVLLGNRALATGLIVDDDDPPRINFVAATGSTAEPGELVEITVRLSEVSGRPVTVTLAKAGTATAGSDYHAPARLTIPAGERIGTFTLEVVDDAVAESTETAVIALTSPSGATLGTQKTYRLTIADDE